MKKGVTFRPFEIFEGLKRKKFEFIWRYAAICSCLWRASRYMQIPMMAVRKE